MPAFTDLLSSAHEYAQLGYPVFPLVPGTKDPLTKHGFKDASIDPAQIATWWTQFPHANIGIPTAGLLLLDVDGADNQFLTGERLMEASCGAVSVTPRGGHHHLFRQPAGRAWRNTEGQLAPHVDTRADGGYFVVPPSQVGDKVYQWLPGFELSDSPDRLPEPPAWLTDLVDKHYQEKETGPATPGNPIPAGQRNGTLARLAGTMRRVGMTQPEILVALSQTNQDRCQPPLAPREVERIAASITRYAPDQVSVAFAEDHFEQDFGKKPETLFSTAQDLCAKYPCLRQPVIHGLLREGETMNVIAAPKAGKSWLVQNLAFSVATGQPWLGHQTESGRVLLLDNELHQETLASRIRRITEAMQLEPEQWQDSFYVRPLRGELEDLFKMETYFHSLPQGYFKLIVLDAFYRFMPRDMDENDNGTMANLYNLIDRCAQRLSCAFVLIHHTTKGVQSGKGVTDVGAGAGSQSRAADCHFILRPHEQDECLVVEAVARSWPPPMPFVIRQTFPLWTPDPTLDPENLKKPEDYARRSRAQAAETEGPAPEPWTPERFVSAFILDTPRLRALITIAANENGLKDHQAEKLIEKAEALGLIHRWVVDKNRVAYATVPQPAPEPEQAQTPQAATKRQKVEALLCQSPQLGVREIARQCSVAPSFVIKVRKEIQS